MASPAAAPFRIASARLTSYAILDPGRASRWFREDGGIGEDAVVGECGERALRVVGGDPPG